MIKAVMLFVGLMAVFAQVFPGCEGQSGTIVGFVDEKFILRTGGEIEYVLVVNGTHYDVPAAFWKDAGVGDIVKFDGRQWTIVRKRSAQLYTRWGSVKSFV